MTVSLHEHIRRCNVYLREALPKARQEQAAGRLELDTYATDCGTNGCVGYWYADAMGVLDDLKEEDAYLENAIISWLDDGDHICSPDSTFFVAVAFGDSRVSLDERESNVRARLAEYESQL